MYCHQGDGAVKILCRPQSNVLVRERFSEGEKEIQKGGVVAFAMLYGANSGFAAKQKRPPQGVAAI